MSGDRVSGAVALLSAMSMNGVMRAMVLGAVV